MNPLPATAGRPPALPEPARQLLLRPRLLTTLQQRFERRLTTLVAGPGFGKTSLLAQAVAENRLSPRGVDAWVSCQPEDNVASTLAQRLLAAIEGTDAPPSVEATVDLIEARIWRRSPTPSVLLLDDAHLISPGSPGARLLAALVDRLPATGHLLLAGRPPLPLPTARLIALGQAVQLDERELAFDGDELTAFAALRSVSPDLMQHTGGWPALAELTASVGEQRAVDFLWEELLARLPVERRRLLAALAVVGGGDAELVSALVDGPVNLDVELAGLPLVFGRSGGWRWLHPLWAPALAGQLAAGEAAGMRRRAAGVLQRRGLVDPAVRLLIQAQAWDELRTLIRETAAAPHPPVVPDVFTAWYSQLPKELQRGPEGLLLRGVVDKGRNLSAAVQLLERAAEKFRQLEDVPGEAAALSNIGHISWWRQDRSRLARVAQRAAELTEKGNVDLLAVAGIAQMFLAELADLDGEEQRALDLLAAIPPDAISDDRSASVEWFRAWELLKLGEPERATPHADAAARQAIGTFHSTGIFIQVLTRWFSGEVDAALARLPALAAATEATGRAQNVAAERALCALLLASSGHDQAAREHLSAAQATLPGASGGSSELTCTVARVVTMIGEGEEDRAGQLLAAELAQRPLHSWSRLHQLFLALSYLLVPPTRAHWDAADLGPRFRTARTLATALVAVRETGATTELLALQLPAHGIVRALLPVPWAAELATALTAVGRPEGRQLLATLGPAARPTVKRLVDTAQPQLAAAARRLLADLPPVPPHRLQLDVLGAFRLHRNGQPVDHRDGRRERVRQLLAYLVIYPTTTRATVTGALWPDLDEEAAGRNLRVNLTHLQRLLEPDRADGEAPFFVRTSATTLQLTGEDWLAVDVWQFDRLLDQADQAERQGVPSRALAAYQQALPLYRGDYLADLPDVDWAELERNRLRLRYQSAAIRAGELLLAGGDTTSPLALAQAALRVEPWSEAAYRLLSAAHLARGDHAAARRALHHCQAMLTDLGAQPEPQTQMLIRRLTPTQPAPGHNASIPAAVP